MTRLQAYYQFRDRPDGGHSRLHPTMPKEKAPLWCTAYASLSGRLGNAQSPADLDEAVAAGINMQGMWVLPPEEFAEKFEAEVRAIEQEIAKHEAELNE